MVKPFQSGKYKTLLQNIHGINYGFEISIVTNFSSSI